MAIESVQLGLLQRAFVGLQEYHVLVARAEKYHRVLEDCPCPTAIDCRALRAWIIAECDRRSAERSRRLAR